MPQSPYIANMRWQLCLATGLLDLNRRNPYDIHRLLPGQRSLCVQQLAIPEPSEDAPGHSVAFPVLGIQPGLPAGPTPV